MALGAERTLESPCFLSRLDKVWGTYWPGVCWDWQVWDEAETQPQEATPSGFSSRVVWGLHEKPWDRQPKRAVPPFQGWVWAGPEVYFQQSTPWPYTQ